VLSNHEYGRGKALLVDELEAITKSGFEVVLVLVA
jgi:hypothetical protein